MTTKYLTGQYPEGYQLGAAYDHLVIEATASVGDYGVLGAKGGTIVNHGEVQSTQGGWAGIRLDRPGLVINASEGSTIATVSGPVGVGLSAGTIVNGSKSDRSATIIGYEAGAEVAYHPGTVVNYATIKGGIGVVLDAGGVVTNGSADDTTATISGGVYGANFIYHRYATVANFGTIESIGRDISLRAGGKVTNGSLSDTTALLSGRYMGVVGYFGAVRLANFGTIDGAAAGVRLRSGGSVVNGSPHDTAALIKSTATQGNCDGLDGAAMIVSNFGTIDGVHAGVSFYGSGELTNGSATDSVAVVAGRRGVLTTTTGGVTLTNYGVIEGSRGVAIRFRSASDVLIVEAGSDFVGKAVVGGGTLEAANGTGVLTGLHADGQVTVSGSMAPAAFVDVGVLQIGASAIFSGEGGMVVGAGRSLDVLGSLTIALGRAPMTNDGMLEVETGGSLEIERTVTGSGEAVIDGGVMAMDFGFAQNVIFGGSTGILRLGQSQAYTGTISGFSAQGGTSLDLKDIGFTGSGEASFSGDAASGVLTVSDGSHTARIALAGDYLGCTFTASSDGSGGTSVVAKTAGAASAPPHAFVSAMAGAPAAASASSVHVFTADRRVEFPRLVHPA